MVHVDGQLVVELAAEGAAGVRAEVDALTLTQLAGATVDALVRRRRLAVDRRQVGLHVGQRRGRVAALDALVALREVEVRGTVM